MNALRTALLLASLALPAALAAQSPIPLLSSPDGRIELQFSIQTPEKSSPADPGQLTWALRFKGKPVVDASPLGLELGTDAPLGRAVVLREAKPASGIDDYPLANAKISHVHDPWNGIQLTLAEPTGGLAARTLVFEARVYNSGIAFRYVLPRQFAISSLHLRGESTAFHLSDDDSAWALALPGYRSSYESEYVPLPISALSNQGGVASHFLIGMPLLLHQPGIPWLSLMEADLEGSAAMYLTNPTGSWTGHSLSVLLSPRWDEPHEAVQGDLPWHSAWRVLGVADSPGALVESNLLTDLSPAPRIADTSWIKPGKASWNWWADNLDAQGHSGDANFTTATMKQYIDFAADSGFPYFFLDAGWSSIVDITRQTGAVDVPELVRYAATKNVKVSLWLSAESVMRQMKDAFPVSATPPGDSPAPFPT